MNKKGFTLIELIATIAILVIITLISYPIINEAITSNKTKLYEEQENRLKDAALKYMNENYIEDGNDVFVINKTTLVENGYINELYDLGQKTEVCDAYVYVTDYLTNPNIKSYLSCVGYVTTGYDSGKIA